MMWVGMSLSDTLLPPVINLSAGHVQKRVVPSAIWLLSVKFLWRNPKWMPAPYIYIYSIGCKNDGLYIQTSALFRIKTAG